MAKLERQNDTLSYYFGWYGICDGETSCADFVLNESRDVYDHVYRVFQINQFGDNYSIFDGTYDFENSNEQQFQDFSSLTCGKAYLIVLREGDGFLNLDNFTYTNDSTASFGGLLRTSCVDANPPTTTEIKQSSDSLSFYMGWYGVCDECTETYDLTIEGHREKIFRVFQINERNENYSVFLPSYTPEQDFMQDFTHLECGRAYLIVLKRGNETLDDLTNFVATNKLSTSAGTLVDDCQAPVGNNLNSPRVALTSENIDVDNMIWFDSSDIPTVNATMYNVTKECGEVEPVPTPTATPSYTPTPSPTLTSFDTTRQTSCGNPCTSLVSSKSDFSNLGDTWTSYEALSQGRVYNDVQSEQINDWSIVLTEISNVSAPVVMQNESHVLQIETRSSSGYNAGFFILDQDAQSETITPNSCATISFKFSFSSTGGGSQGMAYGLVAKQGDNYFANNFGITGQISGVITNIDKELVDGTWLRIAGSGETSHPDWNAPTSFGVFFGNSNSGTTKIITTDFKICVYHPEITPTPTLTPSYEEPVPTETRTSTLTPITDKLDLGGYLLDGYIKNASGQLIDLETDEVVKEFTTDDYGKWSIEILDNELPKLYKIKFLPGGIDILTNTEVKTTFSNIATKQETIELSSKTINISPVTTLKSAMVENKIKKIIGETSEDSEINLQELDIIITETKNFVANKFDIHVEDLEVDYINEENTELLKANAKLSVITESLTDIVTEIEETVEEDKIFESIVTEFEKTKVAEEISSDDIKIKELINTNAINIVKNVVSEESTTDIKEDSNIISNIKSISDVVMDTIETESQPSDGEFNFIDEIQNVAKNILSTIEYVKEIVQKEDLSNDKIEDTSAAIKIKLIQKKQQIEDIKIEDIFHPTPTPTKTSTPTFTSDDDGSGSDEPTPTPTPTETSTPTFTSDDENSGSDEPTPTPTPTETSTPTFTSDDENSGSDEPTPTPTPTETSTPTFTSDDENSGSDEPTPTPTPTETSTPTFTSDDENSGSDEPTPTPTETSTPTFTSDDENSGSDEPTPTPTPTETSTPTFTSDDENSGSDEPTPTPTPTETSTPTFTSDDENSGSDEPTPTPTETSTPTFTSDDEGSGSDEPTPTPTETSTPTFTSDDEGSGSDEPTPTPTETSTPTFTSNDGGS